MAGTIWRKRLQVWLKDPRLPHVCSNKSPAVVKNECTAIIEQWKARERWQMLLTTRVMLVEADRLSKCGTIRLIKTPDASIPDAIVNLHARHFSTGQVKKLIP